MEILKQVTDEELEKLEEEAEEFDGFLIRLYFTSIIFYGGEVHSNRCRSKKRRKLNFGWLPLNSFYCYLIGFINTYYRESQNVKNKFPRILFMVGNKNFRQKIFAMSYLINSMLETADTKLNMQGIILTIDKEELENIIARAIETALLSAGVSHEANEPGDDEIVIMRAPHVCKYLNMKMSTLYQLTHKREIPCYKKGKILYFKKDEIDQWIVDGKQHTINEQNFARELRIIASDKKRHKTFV